MRVKDPFQPVWPAVERPRYSRWPGPLGRYWKRGVRQAVVVELLGLVAFWLAVVPLFLWVGLWGLGGPLGITLAYGVQIGRLVHDARRNGWPPPDVVPTSRQRVAQWLFVGAVLAFTAVLVWKS